MRRKFFYVFVLLYCLESFDYVVAPHDLPGKGYVLVLQQNSFGVENRRHFLSKLEGPTFDVAYDRYPISRYGNEEPTGKNREVTYVKDGHDFTEREGILLDSIIVPSVFAKDLVLPGQVISNGQNMDEIKILGYGRLLRDIDLFSSQGVKVKMPTVKAGKTLPIMSFQDQKTGKELENFVAVVHLTPEVKSADSNSNWDKVLIPRQHLELYVPIVVYSSLYNSNNSLIHNVFHKGTLPEKQTLPEYPNGNFEVTITLSWEGGERKQEPQTYCTKTAHHILSVEKGDKLALLVEDEVEGWVLAMNAENDVGFVPFEWLKKNIVNVPVVGYGSITKNDVTVTATITKTPKNESSLAQEKPSKKLQRSPRISEPTKVHVVTLKNDFQLPLLRSRPNYVSVYTPAPTTANINVHLIPDQLVRFESVITEYGVKMDDHDKEPEASSNPEPTNKESKVHANLKEKIVILDRRKNDEWRIISKMYEEGSLDGDDLKEYHVEHVLEKVIGYGNILYEEEEVEQKNFVKQAFSQPSTFKKVADAGEKVLILDYTSANNWWAVVVNSESEKGFVPHVLRPAFKFLLHSLVVRYPQKPQALSHIQDILGFAVAVRENNSKDSRGLRFDELDRFAFTEINTYALKKDDLEKDSVPKREWKTINQSNEVQYFDPYKTYPTKVIIECLVADMEELTHLILLERAKKTIKDIVTLQSKQKERLERAQQFLSSKFVLQGDGRKKKETQMFKNERFIELEDIKTRRQWNQPDIGAPFINWSNEVVYINRDIVKQLRRQLVTERIIGFVITKDSKKSDLDPEEFAYGPGERYPLLAYWNTREPPEMVRVLTKDHRKVRLIKKSCVDIFDILVVDNWSLQQGPYKHVVGYPASPTPTAKIDNVRVGQWLRIDYNSSDTLKFVKITVEEEKTEAEAFDTVLPFPDDDLVPKKRKTETKEVSLWLVVDELGNSGYVPSECLQIMSKIGGGKVDTVGSNWVIANAAKTWQVLDDDGPIWRIQDQYDQFRDIDPASKVHKDMVHGRRVKRNALVATHDYTHGPFTVKKGEFMHVILQEDVKDKEKGLVLGDWVRVVKPSDKARTRRSINSQSKVGWLYKPQLYTNMTKTSDKWWLPVKGFVSRTFSRNKTPHNDKEARKNLMKIWHHLTRFGATKDGMKFLKGDKDTEFSWLKKHGLGWLMKWVCNIRLVLGSEWDPDIKFKQTNVLESSGLTLETLSENVAKMNKTTGLEDIEKKLLDDEVDESDSDEDSDEPKSDLKAILFARTHRPPKTIMGVSVRNAKLHDKQANWQTLVGLKFRIIWEELLKIPAIFDRRKSEKALDKKQQAILNLDRRKENSELINGEHKEVASKWSSFLVYIGVKIGWLFYSASKLAPVVLAKFTHDATYVLYVFYLVERLLHAVAGPFVENKCLNITVEDILHVCKKDLVRANIAVEP